MKGIVDDLIKKYNTRNPFVIAEKLGITVTFENLGDIAGYYNKAFNKKFIHINSDLKEYRFLHLVSVLLYHSIKDDEYYIVYREKKERLDYSDIEIKADKFALVLLDQRNKLLELSSMEEGTKLLKMSSEDIEHFYKWLDTVTHGKRYKKYKDCDRINQALYIIDTIENW